VLLAHIMDQVTTKGNVSVGVSTEDLGIANARLLAQLEELGIINVILLNESLGSLLDLLDVGNGLNVAALVKILEFIASKVPVYGDGIEICKIIWELIATLKSDLDEVDKKLFELECFEFAIVNASALVILHVNVRLKPLPVEEMESLSLPEALEKAREKAMKQVQSTLAEIRSKRGFSLAT
jgi:hypothetical protein